MHRLMRICTLMILTVVTHSAEADLERRSLARPSGEINLPSSVPGEYSHLTVMQDGPRVRLEWLDEAGKPHYVYWDSNYLMTVQVEASVVESASGGEFEYRYMVRNDAESLQSLTGFILESKIVVLEQKKPSSFWRAEQLPRDVWKRDLYSWWLHPEKTPESALFIPGRFMDGFGFYAKGPPTIVECWAYAFGAVTTTDQELPDTISIELRLHQGLLTNALHGITVGPGDKPPTCSNLKEYLRVSIEHGWVEEGALQPNLWSLVERIAECSGEGQLDKAIEGLSTLHTLVDTAAKSDPPRVTSEVEALLGTNALILRRQFERELEGLREKK